MTSTRRWTYAGVGLAILIGLLLVLRWQTLENGSKTRSTEALMEHIQDQLKDYHTKCGRYPSTDEGLEPLYGRKGIACKDYIPASGSQLPAADVWGHPFIYKSNGDTYSLISAGNAWIEATSQGKPKKAHQDEGITLEF